MLIQTQLGTDARQKNINKEKERLPAQNISCAKYLLVLGFSLPGIIHPCEQKTGRICIHVTAPPTIRRLHNT